MARPPQSRQPAQISTAEHIAQIDPLLEQAFSDDANSRERSLLNSAQAWRPTIPALTAEEVQQGIDFWQSQSNYSMTPRATVEQDLMLDLLRRRQQEIQAEASAVVDANYKPQTPRPTSRLAEIDRQNMDQMLNGPYRSNR